MKRVPVFRIEPRTAESGLCEYVGDVDPDKEMLIDETLDLNDTRNKAAVLHALESNFSDIGAYSLKLHFKKCNLIGDYVVSHDAFPVYVSSVYYEGRFVKGHLFALLIEFVMDDETKRSLMSINDDGELVRDPRKHMGHELRGRFVMRFTTSGVDNDDDVFFPRLLEDASIRVRDELFLAHSDAFSKLDQQYDDDMRAFFEDLDAKADAHVQQCRAIINTHVTLDHLLYKRYAMTQMQRFWMQQQIRSIVTSALRIREQERIESLRIDPALMRPPDMSRVINLDAVRHDPSTLDAMLGHGNSNYNDIDDCELL